MTTNKISDDKNERAWAQFVRIMVDGGEFDAPTPVDGEWWPRAAVRMPWKRWTELDRYVRSLCRALDAHESGLVTRSAESYRVVPLKEQERALAALKTDRELLTKLEECAELDDALNLMVPRIVSAIVAPSPVPARTEADFEALFAKLNSNGGMCYKEHAEAIRAFVAPSPERTSWRETGPVVTLRFNPPSNEAPRTKAQRDVDYLLAPSSSEALGTAPSEMTAAECRAYNQGYEHALERINYLERELAEMTASRDGSFRSYEELSAKYVEACGAPSATAPLMILREWVAAWDADDFFAESAAKDKAAALLRRDAYYTAMLARVDSTGASK